MVNLSGQGNIDATALKAQTADVVLSGQGSIQLNVARQITLGNSGQGSVTNIGAASVPAAGVGP